MKCYYCIFLFLIRSCVLFVECHTIPIQTGHPSVGCTRDGLCLMGDGREFLGELLEGYIGPNTTIISSAEFAATNSSLLRTGDILVDTPADIPKLRSAVIDQAGHRH